MIVQYAVRLKIINIICFLIKLFIKKHNLILFKMASTKECNQLTKGEINIAIQKYLAAQLNDQKEQIIRITSYDVSNYIKQMYKCSGTINLSELEEFIKPLISKRNEHLVKMSKPDVKPRKFILGENPLVYPASVPSSPKHNIMISAEDENYAMSNIPTVFSNTININNFTISTSNWPNNLILVPEFLLRQQQDKLFLYLHNLLGNREHEIFGNITEGGGYTSVKIPEPLVCLRNFLIKYQFGNWNPGGPNQIVVREYGAKRTQVQNINVNQFNPPMVFLSLGYSPNLFMFRSKTDTNKIIQVPLLPGSLLIIGKEIFDDWTFYIDQEANKYNIPYFNNQSWVPSERMIVLFRHIIIS